MVLKLDPDQIEVNWILIWIQFRAEMHQEKYVLKSIGAFLKGW
jgi:hypothetical protein